MLCTLLSNAELGTGGCRFGCLVTLAEFKQQVISLNPSPPPPAPPPKPPSPPTSRVQLFVFPSVISSGSWVNVSWTNITTFERDRNTSEYICIHDGESACLSVLLLLATLQAYILHMNKRLHVQATAMQHVGSLFGWEYSQWVGTVPRSGRKAGPAQTPRGWRHRR